MVGKVNAILRVLPQRYGMRKLCGVFIGINVIYFFQRLCPAKIMEGSAGFTGQVSNEQGIKAIAKADGFAFGIGVEISQQKQWERPLFLLFLGIGQQLPNAQNAGLIAFVIQVTVVDSERLSPF